MNRLTPLLIATLLGSSLLPAGAEESDPIGRERLAAAYAHTRIAMDLARGGAAQPVATHLKEVKDFPVGQLRKDIGIMADNTVSAFHGTPRRVRLDVIAHLQTARLKVTTDDVPPLRVIRDRFGERYARQVKAGQNPSGDDDLREIAKSLKEALRAI